MHTHRIDKLITAISPLTISDPGAYKASVGSYFVGDTGDFPTSKTKTLPFVGTEGKLAFVPYLPGTSLRGALRTCAAEVAMRRLKENGQMSKGREVYYCIMSGSASASPDGNPPSLTESIFAAKNPFVGGFGGGPKLVWGRIMVGHAVPITGETIHAGMVPIDYQQEASASPRLTDVVWSVKKDPMRMNRGKLPIIIENPEKVIAEWLGELAASKDTREKEQAAAKEAKARGEKAEEGSKKTDISTVYGQNIVIPGTKFFARDYLDTELAGVKMLGLYALGLAAFANEQRLGGGAARGNGRFLITATCSTPSGETFPVLEVVDGMYRPAKSAPIQAAVAEWDQWSATATMADYEKAFSLTSSE